MFKIWVRYIFHHCIIVRLKMPYRTMLSISLIALIISFINKKMIAIQTANQKDTCTQIRREKVES